MQLNRTETIKKALLDTQERVRDYMNYAQMIDDTKLSQCFKEHAQVEARHAQLLQGYLSNGE